LSTDVKLLLQAALALLAIGAIIGAIAAQNRFVLAPEWVAAHIASGALGWMLLGIVAFALMLFGAEGFSALERRSARAVSVLVVVSVCCYVLAAWRGSPLARVVCIAAVLLAIVALLGWLGMRSAQIRLCLAHLALLLAVLALTFGATIATLIEIQSLTHMVLFPGDTASSRPVVLSSGYLVLAGMALLERRLRPAAEAWPRLGVAQVGLAFVAAMALGTGILLNMAGVVPLAAALELATGAVFVVRFAPRVLAVRWLERGSERQYALASVFLVAYLVFFVYLLVRLTLHAYPDYGDIPTSLSIALGHLLFLGAITNALFGLIIETARERRGVWPATEDVLFWGMNLGLLGFVTGLVVRNSVVAFLLQGIFASILGAALVVGVAALGARLQMSRVRIEAPEVVRAGG
jgi:hypothetical protein